MEVVTMCRRLLGALALSVVLVGCGGGAFGSGAAVNPPDAGDDAQTDGGSMRDSGLELHDASLASDADGDQLAPGESCFAGVCCYQPYTAACALEQLGGGTITWAPACCTLGPNCRLGTGTGSLACD